MTEAAVPKYAIGQMVRYRDHQDRAQCGRVQGIRANWYGWASDPLIVYDLSHPTYRNNRMYASDEDIQGTAS